ncbi:Hydrolase-4 domain-containing protein [Mycena sanguinolenta]|uniref:Hydrolase-4 domain-containing protein n=1 Tax=Mycena sanguinolenta TaxID=230812 RepID=A0A8H6XLA0_9AGAR|nr:Hydrolase-4 domain-containing protein [Mycena sanguinolenta]
MASSVSRYVWGALLVPSLLAASYVLASSPIVPKQLPAPTDPGFASLPLNSRARVIYPEDFIEGGAYVQLPMGRVRYWLTGPTFGKKATGFSYTTFMGGVTQMLPQDTAYDPQLYVVQLALLLQHLNWTRVRLVGYSMGGAIAASFVASFSALVEPDVVLIASGGAGSPNRSMLSKFRHWWFVEHRVKRRLATRIAQPDAETAIQEIVRLQAEHHRGYPRAVISSLHDGILTKLQWAFSSPAWRDRRVLLINGDRDSVIPPVAAQVLRQMLESAHASSPLEKSEGAPPEVVLVPVAGAAHDVTWTHTQEVTSAILGFWDSAGSTTG